MCELFLLLHFRIIGKIAFWDWESLHEALNDLNGFMFKERELQIHCSDAKAGNRSKKAAQTVSVTVKQDSGEFLVMF